MKTVEFDGCEAYEIGNDRLRATVLSLGGILQSLTLDGKDLVCGFDSAAEYRASDTYFGAVIGRVSNRIGDGRFALRGKIYTLAKNEKDTTHLHGGIEGFDKKIWEVRECPDGLTLSRISPDGEEGYPGKLKVKVTYTIRDTALRIRYEAVGDADTPVSMTNHTYFNLGGAGSGEITDHTLSIASEAVSKIDTHFVTTGKYFHTAGSCLDFSVAKPIGRDINDTMLEPTHGYDHNYILKNANAAVLSGHGLRMKVRTSAPCMQLYTGNYIPQGTMKKGLPMFPRCGLCLETQLEPNAVSRGTGILSRNSKYDTFTVFEFEKDE